MTRLVQHIEESAQQYPDQIILEGSQPISWQELEENIDIVAQWLSTLSEDILPFKMDNSEFWVYLDIACIKAGKISVPLPTFFSQQQMEWALKKVGSSFYIEHAGNVATNPNWNSNTEPPLGYQIKTLSREKNNNVTPPEGTQKITFTSGSTGQPKGVCLDMNVLETVANSLNNRLANIELKSQLCSLPLAILLENVAGLYRCLLSGQRYIIPSLNELGFANGLTPDAKALYASIERHQPHTLITMPGMLEALVNNRNRMAFTCLKYVAVGGAPTPIRTLTHARIAGIPAYEGYGLSEAGSVVSLNVPDNDKPGSTGKPLPHITATTENHELVIDGASFLGYLGEQPTSNRKVETGDIAVIDTEGFIRISGRKKNLIINSMGRNISPEWLESILLEKPEISQCCVVYYNDNIVALITCENPETLTPMIKEVNKSLPDYARINSFVVNHEPFSITDKRLTDNGRLKRAEVFKYFMDNDTDKLICINQPAENIA